MITVPSNGFNIPRNQLPQISTNDIQDYLSFLDSLGIIWSPEVVLTKSIRPSQAEYNDEKVQKLMGSNPIHLKSPLLISSDNVLLDGHHRWLAQLTIDPDGNVLVYRVDLPFLALVSVTMKFPKVFYKKIDEVYKSGDKMSNNKIDENFNSFLYDDLLQEGVDDSSIFKAIFIAGGSGSGKDFVMKQVLDGLGLIELNSEKALAFLNDKKKLDKSMPGDLDSHKNVIRNRSKSIVDLKGRLALQGRNGLIINGSASEFDTTKKIKDHLEDMGYETKMLFVNTSDEVSRHRNVSRSSKGGREIPEKKRAMKWAEAQDAKMKYEELFGKEDFIHFDNSEDLSGETPSKSGKDVLERHGVKYKELQELRCKMEEFVAADPKHEVCQVWMQQGRDKAAKSKTMKEESDAPLSAVKRTDRDPFSAIKNAGLEYYGHGRYGRAGKATHLSIDGKLIKRPKVTTKPTRKTLKEITNGNSEMASILVQETDSVSPTRPTDSSTEYSGQDDTEKKKVDFRTILDRLRKN